MLLDTQPAVEAGEAQSLEGPASDTPAPRKRLSDEEQLYVWCLLLQNNLVGQVSPVNAKSWLKPRYEILVPDSLVLGLLNSVSDTPVTIDQIKAIMKRFQGSKPPYDSFNLPPVRGSK